MKKILFKKFKTKKCYPLFFIIIFLSPLIILRQLGVEIAWIGISIAWLVGLGAIMQSQISRCFFMPSFSVSIKEVPTKTVSGESQKWYNFSIRNSGFSSAQNVRVKIKDDESKSWINLTLPFRDKLEQIGKDITCIENLSVGEENDFNIGFIKTNNNFILTLNIYPNNQKTVLRKDEKQLYFLEIVADNVGPHSYKLQIYNEGYEKFGTSHIKLF